MAIGCMAIRTQSELTIRRVQFTRRTKEASTRAACARNVKGQRISFRIWFNNRENEDVFVVCSMTDEEDEI